MDALRADTRVGMAAQSRRALPEWIGTESSIEKPMPVSRLHASILSSQPALL